MIISKKEVNKEENELGWEMRRAKKQTMAIWLWNADAAMMARWHFSNGSSIQELLKKTGARDQKTKQAMVHLGTSSFFIHMR